VKTNYAKQRTVPVILVNVPKKSAVTVTIGKGCVRG